MKRRILSSPLVGPCCAEVLRTSTFHAFAVEMLRRDGDKVGVKPNFGIITEAKRRKLVALLASTEGASPAAVQTALDQSAEGAAGIILSRAQGTVAIKRVRRCTLESLSLQASAK